jgi:hypothetical protein
MDLPPPPGSSPAASDPLPDAGMPAAASTAAASTPLPPAPLGSESTGSASPESTSAEGAAAGGTFPESASTDGTLLGAEPLAPMGAADLGGPQGDALAPAPGAVTPAPGQGGEPGEFAPTAAAPDAAAVAAAPIVAAPPAPTPRAKTKGVADIVFLIDVSGSMQPCLDALRRNIEVFVDSLSHGDANNAAPVKDWRGKVVGYRDIEASAGEGTRWLDDHPFVRDAVALKAQLGNLRAEGGGDEPESLLDALYTVATMEASPKGAQSEERTSGATGATPRAWWWCSPTPRSRRPCRSRRPAAARSRTWPTW